MNCQLMVVVVAISILLLYAGTAQGQVLWIEAEDFEITGTWTVQYDTAAFGGQIMRGLTTKNQSAQNMFTYVSIPEEGIWHLWVRTRDYTQDQGSRFFSLSVAGQAAQRLFGRHGQDGWAWEYGGSFYLEAGPALLSVKDDSRYYARVDSIVLTTDENFVPPNNQKSAMAEQYRVVPPKRILGDQVVPLAEIVGTPQQAELLHTLENDRVRLEFYRMVSDRQQWIYTKVLVKVEGEWVDPGISPATEQGYLLLQAPAVTFGQDGCFPYWDVEKRLTLEDQVFTSRERTRNAFAAGGATWIPCQDLKVQDENTVVLSREEGDFAFEAQWSLGPADNFPRLTLRFQPQRTGYYSLAFVGFGEYPVDQVDFLLLPFLWHSRRLPAESLMLVESFTPTPISLGQVTTGQTTVSYGVVADPGEIRLRWPRPVNSRFGLTIRGPAGGVLPVLFAPIMGSQESLMQAGTEYAFTLQVLVQPGDWFGAYRKVVEEEFGFHDYRSNWSFSLNDAIFNMIDLIMDDQASGWDANLKGHYNIEHKGGVSHVAPAMPLALYRLTGDRDILVRRAIPTIEFMLSRSGAHFTYDPSEQGALMQDQFGENKHFGASTYHALWELTDRLTPALQARMWQGRVVQSSTYINSVPRFAEELAAWRATQDPELLAQVLEEAYRYYAEEVAKPQTEDLGVQPFFASRFVPHWVGFVDLYEFVQEDFVLAGALEGARWLLTGLWTQPPFMDQEITVNPYEVVEKSTKTIWWYGTERFRLGAPMGLHDVRVETVPAWITSQAGLGIEQPMTFAASDRVVMMANWAADLIRLTEITGDAIYRTFARNAVIGRFANYPGYYLNNFVTMHMYPEYPYEGPDYTSLYYHHIYSHLAYSLDFLFAEAHYRSQGEISFPWVRQQGYVWFSNRFYGHRPGTFYGFEEVWPWLNRDVLTLDDYGFNYVTAHNGDHFFVFLMSEAKEARTVQLTFDRELLGLENQALVVSLYDHGRGQWLEPISLDDATLELTVPAQEQVALVVYDTNIQVETHRTYTGEREEADTHWFQATYVPLIGNMGAASIQVSPEEYYVYVYSTAEPVATQKVIVSWYTEEGKVYQEESTTFPYEFTFRVPSDQVFNFQVQVIDKLNRRHQSSWQSLKGTAVVQ